MTSPESQLAPSAGPVSDRTAANNALIEGVQLGNTADVRAALEAGADPNLRHAFGAPMLFLAIMAGATDIVRALLEAGAAPSDDRVAPSYLSLAAFHRRTPIARLLLEAGAPIDAVDKRGRSALMVAAELDALGVVEALLDAGADWMLRDKHGRTAEDRARSLHSSQAPNILDLLRHHRERRELEHTAAPESHDPGRVRMM